jgi:hypothetical protein
MAEVAPDRKEVALASQREYVLMRRHINLCIIVKDLCIYFHSDRKDILQVQAEKLQLEKDLHGQIGGFGLFHHCTISSPIPHNCTPNTTSVSVIKMFF